MHDEFKLITLEEWISFLKQLYAQGDGLITITLDRMFKKACHYNKGFLIHLLHQGLRLPPNSVITDAAFENTEMIPRNLKNKAYRLDMLVRFKLKDRQSKKTTINLANIEIYHSYDRYILQKFISYGVKIFDSQVLKGSDDRYGDIKDVYSLVIIKDKLSFFKGTKLYHHHHIYGIDGDRDSGISLPAPKYSIVELGKLHQEFHEITTEGEKLWYFIDNSDRFEMSLEAATAILIQGGPVAEALKIQIAESLSEENRKTLEYVAAERAERAAWGREVFAKGEAKGIAKAQTKFAQKLIEEGFEHDKIAQLTGLSSSEVKALSLEN